jgi:hypothetical protein
MTSKKELLIASILAAVLFITGVVSYAAFPPKALDQPLRIMFKCVAGKVLFDHQIHAADSGYDIACKDCHHNLEEDETEPEACGACHEPVSEDEDTPNRADAFHSQCIGCHKESDAGPMDKDCALCHVM